MKAFYYILFKINSQIFYLYFLIYKLFFNISNIKNTKIKIYYSLTIWNNNKKKDIDELYIKTLLINNKNNFLLFNKKILENNIGFIPNNINEVINYEKNNSKIINYNNLKKNTLFLKKIINIKIYLIIFFIIFLSISIYLINNNLENKTINKIDIINNDNKTVKEEKNKNTSNNIEKNKTEKKFIENKNLKENKKKINNHIEKNTNITENTNSNFINNNNNIKNTNEEVNKDSYDEYEDVEEIKKKKKTFLDYVIETLDWLKNNSNKDNILFTLISILGILTLLTLLSYIFLKIFWKYIVIYWIIVLIINIISFLIYPEELILNILFLLIILSWIIISLFDLVTYKKLNYKEKKKLKKYFIFRNYYFIIYLTITFFLIIFFLVYQLDPNIYNLVNEKLNLTKEDSVSVLFLNKYLLWIYIYLSIIFFILIYTNLIKIVKWVFLKHLDNGIDYWKLIKNTEKENLVFFYKNKNKINEFKFYLENFLFINSNTKNYIRYILSDEHNKNIKSYNYFKNNKKYNYPKTFFINLINNIKIKKDKFSGSWDYKVISYLDKWDEYSHISTVNIKKSIKLNEIIINKYENDIWSTYIDKVYVNINNILEAKNLNEIKILLEKLKEKKVTIKKLYLCTNWKVNKVIHNTTYQKLLNYLDILISNKTFIWKELIFPKFIIKNDHKYIKKLEFIYNLVYNKIENNKLYKMNNFTGNNNLYI